MIRTVMNLLCVLIAITSGIARAHLIIDHPRLTPISLAIPTGGFVSPQNFIFQFTAINGDGPISITVHDYSLTLIERDPFDNDTIDTFTNLLMPPVTLAANGGFSLISIVMTANAANLNAANDGLEFGALEFFNTGTISWTQGRSGVINETSIPESPIIGLLLVGLIGLAAKYKLRRTKRDYLVW
jgi:UDP-N-acetylmuramyl pentapeptide phosphotransferase/UDP-N-acetylglucosamine-1-phosphate transferase